MKGASRKPRTLKADKPCRECGKPIHYTYSGPIEGVCGRCTDNRKRRRRPVRPFHHGMIVNGRMPKRRSTASTVVLIAAVMLGGAMAVAIALGLLLG